MKLSLAGAEALSESEGIRKEVYKDSASYPTIGVGHLITEADNKTGLIHGYNWKNGITRAVALEIFLIDVERFEGYVNQHVTQPLKQHQFDVLVSFCYNVGPHNFERSTLLKKVNVRDYEAVSVELMKWTIAGGRRVQGLINRRQREVAQWEGSNVDDTGERGDEPRYHKTQSE